MRSVHRILGIALLMSLGSWQPALASCGGPWIGEGSTTGATPVHANHDESAHAHSPEKQHAPSHAPDCGPMAACAVALPALSATAVPSAFDDLVNDVFVPRVAHASAAASVEPPPPRKTQI